MLRPLHPDILTDLQAGLAHHQAGRLDRAETLYQSVLRRHPEDPDALNLLGVIAHERGRPVRAVQLLSKAVRVKPSFPEAFTNLARSQRAAGDLEGAIYSARRATELNPNLAEAHIQLGRALLDAGDDSGSAAASRAAMALAPRSLDAHVNLGAALTKLKAWEEAARAYQQAHVLKPDRPETLIDFGSALIELHLFDDARRCFEKAALLAPADARAHAGLAVTLKRDQLVAEAVAACRQCLSLDPDRTDIWIILGGSLASLGRFAEAAEAYHRAQALEPDSAEASRGLVVVGQLVPNQTEIARLRSLAADEAQDATERVSAGFALGRLFDDAGDFDPAFQFYAGANRLARKLREEGGKGFNRQEFQRQIGWYIENFTPETFARAREWGNPSKLPVFIVGMPRSGTTLTEQIAASHPRVFGAGERPEIGRIGVGLAGGEVMRGPAKWDPKAVRLEAETHIHRLQIMGGGADRVTDKMPDNVFWLGLIAMLFPRARIVLCRRDLRDVCLSCYFQHFTAGLPWTHDLSDLAFRANETERLVAHWRRVLPMPILDLQYETLVADLEGQSRRLIAFLGLEWDPACLAFHETERQVLTASLWQVRQPLYSSSVGRWQNYRDHLGPLLTELEDAGSFPSFPAETF